MTLGCRKQVWCELKGEGFTYIGGEMIVRRWEWGTMLLLSFHAFYLQKGIKE